MSTKAAVSNNVLEITQFNGGLNVIKSDHDIFDSQAASCMNVYNEEILGLYARYGYEKYYAAPIVAAGINALFVHHEATTSTILFAADGNFYKDLGSSLGAAIVYPDVGLGHIRSFEMEGNSYFLDGSGYWYYDGGVAATVSAYIPTYWIDTDPDGTGGGILDELNYLSSSFIQTFNGDGHSVDYQLQLDNITDGDNIVIVGGTTLTTGVDYTVNAVGGIVTFTLPPAIGIGNVSIQAQKTILDANEILQCTLCVSYGVGNTINAYVGGNPNFPARIHWSDLLDPTYFPSTSYADIGVKNDKIMGFLGHANSLLIFKYQSIHAFNGIPPNNSVAEIYVNEGLVATDSLRLADGYPTFFSQRGVCILEKQDLGYVLTLISEDVNGIKGIRDGMLTETLAHKQEAFAFVKDKKYWLWLNEKCWIYEYYLKRIEEGRGVFPWIPWTSRANFDTMTMFAEKDEDLYFAASGNFFMFNQLKFDDDGLAINSYWLSKKFHVGESYDLVKSFDYQYWHLKAYSNIATSDLLLTNQVSGYVNPKILVMTPDLTTQYVSYDVRHPIHFQSPDIQYSIRQDTVSGGFSLMGTKILFTASRKSIET